MEFVDILDDQGNSIGSQVTLEEAHRDGLWHDAAHVWIYNSKGDVLVQLRTKRKRLYPGLWDISAAGHVSAGETVIAGACRELEEELGIIITSEELAFVAKVPRKFTTDGLNIKEFYNIYLLQWDGDPSTLRLQESEVSDVKFIPLEQFEQELNDPAAKAQYVPHDQGYYCIVINAIKKALQK